MQQLIITTACVFISAFLQAQSLDLVNSPYDEQNPVISPDKQWLYFTRANHPENIDGTKDPGDIWVSRKLSNGSWGPPKHAGEVINSKTWNGVLGFNSDGTTLYLHHHYSERGRPRTQGIAYSRRIGDRWTSPVNMAIPYFKNLSSHQSGWLSDDENILIASFEGYSTTGAEDIYVILRNADGSWREPVNLGTSVNTAYQEFTPFYNEKDSILYFSSNGRGGKGSSDVFFSKRLDNTWRNWASPVALGDSINTNGKDVHFINYETENFAIYSSTQNSDGYGDLKIHRYGESPENNVSGRSILVVNERTGDYLNAQIELTDEAGRTYNLQANSSGADISTYAPGIYKVNVSASGFLTYQADIEVAAEDQQLTIVLKPLEVGTRVVLEDVLFEQSKATILPESYEQLDYIVRLMQENPDLKIRLEGHTDTRGSARANLKLSKMRVEAVEDYLINKGISRRRIKGKGYGGEQPLYPGDTEEQRMKNRRVEFVIVEQ